jgi:hypothetical protein
MSEVGQGQAPLASSVKSSSYVEIVIFTTDHEQWL